jgi:hypothetical protein
MEILKRAALVAAATVLFTGTGFAQAQQKPQGGGGQCALSYEQCVARSMSKGWTSKEAGRACGRRGCQR